MSNYDVERSHFRAQTQTIGAYQYLVGCERLSATGWREEEGVGWHGPAKTDGALEELADARNEEVQRIINSTQMERARNRLRNLDHEPEEYETETHVRKDGAQITHHHTWK